MSRDKDEVTNEIKKVFAERIQPAVAQDGGEISFIKFEEGVVYVKMSGACVGCPSSTITLKYGIENLLRFYFPEVISVEDVTQPEENTQFGFEDYLTEFNLDDTDGMEDD